MPLTNDAPIRVPAPVTSRKEFNRRYEITIALPLNDRASPEMKNIFIRLPRPKMNIEIAEGIKY